MSMSEVLKSKPHLFIHTHHLVERVLQYFQTEFQAPSTLLECSPAKNKSLREELWSTLHFLWLTGDAHAFHTQTQRGAANYLLKLSRWEDHNKNDVMAVIQGNGKSMHGILVYNLCTFLALRCPYLKV